MEHRLEAVARQGRKEQTDLVVSALTSSITQGMEQVVSHEMKRILPGLVSTGMAGVERSMMKLGWLENRLAKEAIGCAMVKGVTIDIDG